MSAAEFFLIFVGIVVLFAVAEIFLWLTRRLLKRQTE